MNDIEVLHDRYARALLGYAKDRGKLKEVFSDLGVFVELVRKNSSLEKILYHPFVSGGEKHSLIDAVNKKKDLSREFMDFLKLLIKRKRIQLLHGIFLKYRDLYDELLGRVKVFLKTAVPPEKEAISKIEKILSGQFKEEIVIDHSIDKSLIGGVYLKVHDTVYDTSVRKKLDVLREDLGVWK